MLTLDVILADVAVEAVKAVKDPNAVTNNFQGAILAFKKGGWIVSLIGAAAMVGRLLIDDAADANWRRSAKHILAAALFAIIAFFVTYQWEMSAPRRRAGARAQEGAAAWHQGQEVQGPWPEALLRT